MANVFISHASTDVEPTQRVHDLVRGGGHQVFLDQDPIDGIPVGTDWERLLYERLRWADAVVCVVTSAYTESRWGNVEIGIARSRGCRVIPVRAELGATHQLLPASIQYIDLTGDDPAARTSILRTLRLLDWHGGTGWPDERPPFPGLRAFSSAERGVFFGRRRDIDGLARELRMPAHDIDRSLLLLVGPSGCGKSSLVQAGLLPTMAREPDWLTVPPIRPGREPTTVLAGRLAGVARDLGLGWPLAEIRRRLEDGGLAELADELVHATPESRPSHLLLAVDQFEELITQTSSDQRQRFAAVLRSGLAGPVHVVATLRPEFLDQILVDAELADLPTRTRTIRPLPGDALPEVIEKPARVAGIEIEDGLVARLVDDTAQGESLPLLAFTLAELSTGVGRGGRLLISRYEQLGGVRGALIRQADAALRDAMAAADRGRDAVLRELLRLVTVDENNEPVRRWVPRADISRDGLAELEPFVTRRLVVTDKIDSAALLGRPTPGDDRDEAIDALGVAHEAFLTAWPPLRAAISRESAALRARREVEQAAQVWTDIRQRQNDHAVRRLWDGGRLAAALSDLGMADGSGAATAGLRRRYRGEPLTAGRIDLTDRAREFLEASRTRDRRRRRRLVGVLSTMLVLALIAAGGAVNQWSVAQAQRDAAIHGRIVSEADRLSSTDVSLAAQLDLLGHQLDPTPDLRTALITMADTPLSTPLPGYRDSVNAVAYRPDGRVLASGDDTGAVRLWDMTDPSRPVQLGPDLLADPKWVETAAFSPDGRVLATGGGQHSVMLWDVSDPARPALLGNPLEGHSDSVEGLVFSRDGRLLASAGQDGTLRLWDVSDPAAARSAGDPLVGHGDVVRAVAMSPNGRLLASGSEDGTLRLWDLRDPARPTQIGQPLLVNKDFFVLDLAFSPDGRMLAGGIGDKSVRLWDVADPAAPRALGRPLTGHTDFVNALAFSPDGQTLATGSGDSTVRLWDVSEPTTAAPLGAPMNARATVASVAFSPDGRQLASGDQDQEVQVWSLPYLLRTDEVGQVQRYSQAIRIAPDGRTVYRGSADGTIRRWDSTDPTRPIPLRDPLAGHQGVVGALDISADGRLLASGSDDRTVRLWDIADPARPTPLGGSFGAAAASILTVAFSRDGRLLASGDRSGVVRLWDISTPARPRMLGEPFTAHEDSSVNAAEFGSDGRTLITSSGDYTVRLWNIADPARPVPAAEPLRAHTLFVNDIVVSPDGRLLASGGADGTVRLWDVTDPARVTPVGEPLNQGNPVFALAFSPDGATLASGGADTTVRLWDLREPARASPIGRPLRGHTDSISGLAFAVDGKTVISGSRDRTMRVWDLDLERVIRRICATSGTPLNEQNWPAVVSPDLPFRQPCEGLSRPR